MDKTRREKNRAAWHKWYIKNKNKKKKELEQCKKTAKHFEKDKHISCKNNQYINKNNGSIAIIYQTDKGYYYTVKYNDFRKEYTSPIFKTKQKAIDDLYLAL